MAKVQVDIKGDATSLKQAVSQAKKDVKELDTTVSKAGDTFKRVAKGGLLALGVAAVAAGKKALSMSLDFNKAMGQVSTLIDGTSKEVEQKTRRMSRDLLIMSVKFGQSTDKLTDGLYNLISVYGESADNLKILKSATRAATAGAADLKDAIDLTAAVTKTWGDTSAEAVDKVNDLAFVAVKMGKTTFPELAQAVPKVTAQFYDLGISQEELFTSFAALTPVMANTAETATALKAAATELIKPNAEMAKVMKSLGIESFKTLTQQKGFLGTWKDIQAEAKKLDMDLGDIIGSTEAYTAVSLALNGVSEKWLETQGKMQDAIGAAQDAFKKATTGVAGDAFKWEQAVAAVNAAFIIMGDVLAPVIVPLVKELSIWVLRLAADFVWLASKMGLIEDSGGEAFQRIVDAANDMESATKESIANVREAAEEDFVGHSVLSSGQEAFSGISTASEDMKTTVTDNIKAIRENSEEEFGLMEAALRGFVDALKNSPIGVAQQLGIGIWGAARDAYGGGGAPGGQYGPEAPGAGQGYQRFGDNFFPVLDAVTVTGGDGGGGGGGGKKIPTITVSTAADDLTKYWLGNVEEAAEKAREVLDKEYVEHVRNQLRNNIPQAALEGAELAGEHTIAKLKPIPEEYQMTWAQAFNKIGLNSQSLSAIMAGNWTNALDMIKKRLKAFVFDSLWNALANRIGMLFGGKNQGDIFSKLSGGGLGSLFGGGGSSAAAGGGTAGGGSGIGLGALSGAAAPAAAFAAFTAGSLGAVQALGGDVSTLWRSNGPGWHEQRRLENMRRGYGGIAGSQDVGWGGRNVTIINYGTIGDRDTGRQVADWWKRG